MVIQKTTASIYSEKQNMSLQEILHNIYCFLDVLQSACTERVAGWSELALQNALEWATYCTQVYQQARGKPYEADLDRQIQELGELPWCIGASCVSLQLMKDAPRVLYQSLLENPHLSSDLYAELVDSSLSSKHHGSQWLIQTCKDLAESKQSVEVLQILLNDKIEKTLDTKDAEMKDQEHVPFTKEGLQAEASILLSYVGRVLAKCSTQKRDRTQTHLKTKLMKLIQDKHGLEVLLICLLKETTDDQLNNASNFLLEFILNTLSTESLILDVDPSLLCEVATVHFNFYKVYFRHLVEVSRTMCPKYGNAESNDTGYFHWRCGSFQDKVTYDTIFIHFRHLINMGGILSKSTTTALKNLAEKSEVNIWETLLTDLQIPLDGS